MEQIKPMTQEDAIVLAFTDGNDSQTLLEIKNLLLEKSKESKGLKQIIHAMEAYKDSHAAPLQAEIDRLKKENEELKEYLSKSLDVILSEGSSRHDWLRGKIRSLIGK